jgi:hypothetical protein
LVALRFVGGAHHDPETSGWTNMIFSGLAKRA